MTPRSPSILTPGAWAAGFIGCVIIKKDCDLRYKAFHELKGWGMLSGDPKSVSLNASYHKEHGLRGRVLNGF